MASRGSNRPAGAGARSDRSGRGPPVWSGASVQCSDRPSPTSSPLQFSPPRTDRIVSRPVAPHAIRGPAAGRHRCRSNSPAGRSHHPRRPPIAPAARSIAVTGGAGWAGPRGNMAPRRGGRRWRGIMTGSRLDWQRTATPTAACLPAFPPPITADGAVIAIRPGMRRSMIRGSIPGGQAGQSANSFARCKPCHSWARRGRQTGPALLTGVDVKWETSWLRRAALLYPSTGNRDGNTRINWGSDKKLNSACFGLIMRKTMTSIGFNYVFRN